jgi:hypothetical protein
MAGMRPMLYSVRKALIRNAPHDALNKVNAMDVYAPTHCAAVRSGHGERRNSNSDEEYPRSPFTTNRLRPRTASPGSARASGVLAGVQFALSAVVRGGSEVS